MKYQELLTLLLILSLSIIAGSCNESISDSDDAGTAIVEGKVESSSQEAGKRSVSEGIVVTPYRVTGDGSLEIFDDDATAETDSRGEFTLNIDAETAGDAKDRIVVVAEDEEREWKAIVPGEIANGENIILKPLNDESTGEASLFQEVIADDAFGSVLKADIEIFAGTQAGTELKDNAEALAEFTDGLILEAETRSIHFENHGVNISGQQMLEIRTSKEDALAELNSSLYAATGDAAAEDAYDLFLDAVTDSYADAGVDAYAYGRAKKAASHFILKNISELPGEARAEIQRNTALLVSVAVDKAMQARLERANALESSIQSASQAGAQLRNEIKAEQTVSRSEIREAYQVYNDEIMDVLTREFAASAQIIISINNEINSTAGIRAALQSAIEENNSPETIVQAYVAFYTDVKATVDEIFPTATEEEAQFIADVMILINLPA